MGVTLLRRKYQPHLAFHDYGGREEGTKPGQLINVEGSFFYPLPFASSCPSSFVQGASEAQGLKGCVLIQALLHGTKAALGLGFWREQPTRLRGRSPIPLAPLHFLSSHPFLMIAI